MNVFKTTITAQTIKLLAELFILTKEIFNEKLDFVQCIFLSNTMEQIFRFTYTINLIKVFRKSHTVIFCSSLV